MFGFQWSGLDPHPILVKNKSFVLFFNGFLGKHSNSLASSTKQIGKTAITKNNFKANNYEILGKEYNWGLKIIIFITRMPFRKSLLRYSWTRTTGASCGPMILSKSDLTQRHKVGSFVNIPRNAANRAQDPWPWYNQL